VRSARRAMDRLASARAGGAAHGRL